MPGRIILYYTMGQRDCKQKKPRRKACQAGWPQSDKNADNPVKDRLHKEG